jgi:hypothetical protein
VPIDWFVDLRLSIAAPQWVDFIARLGAAPRPDPGDGRSSHAAGLERRGDLVPCVKSPGLTRVRVWRPPQVQSAPASPRP